MDGAVSVGDEGGFFTRAQLSGKLKAPCFCEGGAHALIWWGTRGEGEAPASGRAEGTTASARILQSNLMSSDRFHLTGAGAWDLWFGTAERLRAPGRTLTHLMQNRHRTAGGGEEGEEKMLLGTGRTLPWDQHPSFDGIRIQELIWIPKSEFDRPVIALLCSVLHPSCWNEPFPPSALWKWGLSEEFKRQFLSRTHTRN